MKYKILAILLVPLLFLPLKAASAHFVCVDLSQNLRVGMSDKTTKGQISLLQDFLIDNGYLKSEITGYFGQLTLKSVKDFQKENGIPSTGFVWPLTRASIKNKTCLTVEPIPVPKATTTPVLNNQNTVVPTVPVVKSVLPFKMDTFSGWTGTWGDVSLSDFKKLILKATTTTSGAEAIFSDSSEWTDYKFNTNINVKNGDVILLARYKDSNNFLGCTFSGNQISIVQRLNGETKQVASTVLSDVNTSAFFDRNLSISMRVHGKNVGCILVGGQDNISFSNIDDSLVKGGIGISTWLPTLGTASIEVQSVNVEAI